MISYKLSPYISFVQHNLVPGFVYYGVAHRLTGEVVEPNERVRLLLQGIKTGIPISLAGDQLERMADVGLQLKQLIEKGFLIPVDRDPLSPVIDQLVVRPIQNPAITYKNSQGQTRLVRTSLAQRFYAPRKDDLPKVIEEELPPAASQILRLATGDKTLAEIFRCLQPDREANLLLDPSFRAAIDFLTEQERQLIKFTSQPEDRSEPYKPVNTVPRNLVHAHRWEEAPKDDASNPIIDFHLRGIEDAWWEFDQIESTVNHALRFPDQMLGGLDYGSRFCVSTLTPEVTPSLRLKKQLEVLEVGGGTGTFGRSFIEQSRSLARQNGELPTLNYHILDLSPVLIENQKQVLADLLPDQRHFHQDATALDLPGRRFDLIIANEVIADFPVASVQALPANNGEDFKWTGEGASYLEKYGLTTEGAPEEFKVNSGAMMFIERCWEHLNPGGTVVLSEYGSTSGYPVQSFHLNHDEFSIQFTQLAECATKVGFNCSLQSLQEFLGLNQEVPVFCGREEHILCLDHILKQQGSSFPYAIVSEAEFAKRFGKVAKETELAGYSFLQLKKGFYFGPRIEQFMVLIMNKPE